MDPIVECKIYDLSFKQIARTHIEQYIKVCEDILVSGTCTDVDYSSLEQVIKYSEQFKEELKKNIEKTMEKWDEPVTIDVEPDEVKPNKYALIE